MALAQIAAPQTRGFGIVKVFAGIVSVFATVRAAANVAHAVEHGRKPAREDVRALGIEFMLEDR